MCKRQKYRIINRLVIEFENNCVTVLFSETNEKKKFVYPSALGTFLELENPLIIKEIQENKEVMAQKRAMDQKEAEDNRSKEILAIKRLKRKHQLKKQIPKYRVASAGYYSSLEFGIFIFGILPLLSFPFKRLNQMQHILHQKIVYRAK